jgi:hypothetical protein
MMHVSWTTLREQIFAKLRRPYRSEANMNEVGHGLRLRLVTHRIEPKILERTESNPYVLTCSYFRAGESSSEGLILMIALF